MRKREQERREKFWGQRNAEMDKIEDLVRRTCFRPKRKDHKRLTNGTGWIKQHQYDAACNYFNAPSDRELRRFIADATGDVVMIPSHGSTEGVLVSAGEHQG